MVTNKIQKDLLNSLFVNGPGDIILPNCYVGNWEFDVLKLAKNFYLTEYEIKVSKSDFLNDKKKSYIELEYEKNKEGRKVLKNGRLQLKAKIEHNKISKIEDKTYVANKFYYVVPENLIKIEDLPKNVGLIYAILDLISNNYYFRVVKPAPFINKNKHFQDIQLIYNLCLKASIRENNWRIKLNKLKKHENTKKRKCKHL